MKAAANLKPKPKNVHRQVAALPWRRRGAAIEILLITSRETKRWVLPKGWPMEKREPHTAAAQEALEEAGIVGEAEAAPCGLYRYRKRIKTGAYVTCEVEVFPLRVREERRRWREKSQRIRKWFPIREAADLVHEPELKVLMTGFSRHHSIPLA